MEKCSRCGGEMTSIPVGEHMDLICKSCGAVAPLYCTKKKSWR